MIVRAFVRATNIILRIAKHVQNKINAHEILFLPFFGGNFYQKLYFYYR